VPRSLPASSPPILRRFLVVALVGLAGLSVGQTGCGDGGFGSLFGSSSGDGPSGPPADPFGQSGDGGPEAGDPGVLGTLNVDPPSADIAVTVANGVVSNNGPVQFKASYNGQPVAAQWLFDRGELGGFDANGFFRASGKGVGEGLVTARFGAREGTAKIKVTVKATQNGTPSDAPPAPGAGDTGGYGGVGGEPQGPAVPAGTVTKLKGAATAPGSAEELSFVYPYDKTVWPRGLLPPLLMWQTTHDSADAVWVKISQGNYSFEGTYALDKASNGAGIPAGDLRRERVRIEDGVWRTATGGNTGDDLVLELKIHENGVAYGPIKQTWKVAPGILKGTVYYNSYDSKVVTNNGAVLAIKPRSPKPTQAIPGAGACHACHVVSADGSTLFAQDAPDPYAVSASYDLKSANPYISRTTYAGASNVRKFAWSAPYPDGSFALTSSRYMREPFLDDSKLYSRANGNEVFSSGFTNLVTSAVTPSFSPDGKKVAFNFWEGAGANGIGAGAGHSLAVLDHACGAAAGSVKCTSGSAFSNLRQIYLDANRWPGWPSFLPDGKAVLFHNTIKVGDFKPGLPALRDSRQNNILTTWARGTAEVWIADDGGQGARRLDALNGVGYLPTGPLHPDDTSLNYMPTVNPVASGGYYWAVFSSRRLYGNVLTADPWADGTKLDGLEKSVQKKLWVAAIDINTGAVDPSHPAFYLPGQELGAGNARGFWVVDPCKQNGTSCETGDECCNGFCRDSGNGKLVCQDKPPGTQCVNEFEKCTVDGDCCDPKQKCINGKCSLEKPPAIK
jgi:hypothetical protein